MKFCEHCGVMIRKFPKSRPTGDHEWWHVVEVPGSSRTSSTYLFCRLTFATPREE